MNEYDAFLGEIRDNPGDDLPRLVFADWLDEQGDLRAEYIRKFVEWRGASKRFDSELEQEIVNLFNARYYFGSDESNTEEERARYWQIFEGTGLHGSANFWAFAFHKAEEGPEAGRPISFQKLRENLTKAHEGVFPFAFSGMIFNVGHGAHGFEIPVEYLPDIMGICEQSAVLDVSIRICNYAHDNDHGAERHVDISPYVDFLKHSYFSKLQDLYICFEEHAALDSVVGGAQLNQIFQQFPKNNLAYFKLRSSWLGLQAVQRIIECSPREIKGRVEDVTVEAADYLDRLDGGAVIHYERGNLTEQLLGDLNAPTPPAPSP